MLRSTLLALLLVGCASRFGNPGDPLQQDMIANPSKYAPPPGTYRLQPDELPARPLIEASSLPPNEQAERIRLYQQILADQMRDPESVRFRRVSLHRNRTGQDVLCGEINAKNAFGGYVGYERFYADAAQSSPERRAFAVPYFVRNVGLDFIQQRCPQP